MIENIEVFRHNSIRIKSISGYIYIDPFKMDHAPHDAVSVLITHDHYDHFSPEDIEKVACDKTILIVPQNMEKKAQKVSGIVGKIVTVKPGTYHNMDGLEFETVPAYNILKPFHPKSAGWVGYILHTGGQRIYVAGDTDLIKEIKTVKCDIALVPIGGTYTMDAKKAAELVNEIRPSYAIPVHYGEIIGTAADGKCFAEYVKEPVKVVIKI